MEQAKSKLDSDTKARNRIKDYNTMEEVDVTALKTPGQAAKK